ncbi:MAG: glutaminyl-peptide cyclotransferase [Crocinitomicaceae bacterium]|jgi:glutamine cyclotransferase
MSKSKSIIFLTLIILMVGSLVVVPMFDNYSKNEDLSVEVLAEFAFTDNVDMKFGDVRKVNIKHTSLKASKIELFIEDSLVQTWNHPKKNFSYTLESNKFNVGAKELKLVVYKGNAVVFEDSRLMRVLSNINPIKKKASVMKLYPHNQGHFTQGFEFNGNELYEGTGQNGSSLLAKIDLNSGNPIKEVNLEPAYFGEGITILGNNVYQITWQQQKCFVYNKETLEKINEITYNGEGWGLCNDAKHIIMTDGSERLYFRNPQTFEINRIVEVYDNLGPITSLNELEYIDGKIYANVWQQNYILVIDPNSGKVLKKIDCSEVVIKAKGGGEVLNGIAYQPATKKLYLTGKNWSKIAEVVIK